MLRVKFTAQRFLNQISRLPVPHWIQIRLTVIYTYIYIVAFCCGDPTLRTTQMLTCIIPTFDGIYFVATVDRSAGSLLYPKAPKQGFGCSRKSKSIYIYSDGPKLRISPLFPNFLTQNLEYGHNGASIYNLRISPQALSYSF